MKNWDYTFGVPLPNVIQAKLENSGLVRVSNPNAVTAGFEKDAFTPDGYPVCPEPYVIYPSLLYRTIGIPIAETVLAVEEDFRRKASLAALKWLEKVVGTKSLHWSFNGLRFQYDLHGTSVDFCFPDTVILCYNEDTVQNYMALAFPDTKHNDSDWERGLIPRYAENQAQLMLWCSRRYAEICPEYLPAEKAFLVRIKGNLSADVTVRTVEYNEKLANQILLKIYRAITTANASSTTYHEKLVTIPKADWKEEKQTDLENAYRIDTPDFHALLGDYMKARSTRKGLEADAEAVKNQMAGIAYTLAAQIPDGFARAEYEDAGAVYAVSHAPRRKTAPRLSADLLRQLAPEYADAIHVSTTPRGRITIEVL